MSNRLHHRLHCSLTCLQGLRWYSTQDVTRGVCGRLWLPYVQALGGLPRLRRLDIGAITFHGITDDTAVTAALAEVSRLTQVTRLTLCARWPGIRRVGLSGDGNPFTGAFRMWRETVRALIREAAPWLTAVLNAACEESSQMHMYEDFRGSSSFSSSDSDSSSDDSSSSSEDD